jgi:hypothetical protein
MTTAIRVSLMMAALLLALARTAAGRPVCHNITGTCTERGFECVSGEVVTHAQRCNGVEDCSDGTDEFMCEHEDHRPMFERTAEERHAFAQASCVNCNCAATAFTVTTASAWWKYALTSPTDTALMTGSPGNNAGQPCNWKCASGITIGFYRKNRVCRGWLCCSRQRRCDQCSTTSPCTQSSTANRCY